MNNPMCEAARPAEPFAEAYLFEPLPDITAYELAVVMRMANGGPVVCFYAQPGVGVSPVLARHFVRAPEFDQVSGRAR